MLEVRDWSFKKKKNEQNHDVLLAQIKEVGYIKPVIKPDSGRKMCADRWHGTALC